MKVLSIGSDRNLLRENSAARQRIIEYGMLVEEMHIIVFATRITNHESRITKEQLSQNVWVYPTNSRNRWFYVPDAYKIAKRIIGNWKLEIGNCLVTCQDPFESGLVGWLLARKFKLPLQLQLHIDFFSSYFWQESWENKLRVLLGRFLLSKADCVRVVSHEIKEYIVRALGVGESRVMVLPIFTDVEKIASTVPTFDLHQKYPRFDFIIVMVSRLVKQKNIGLAIEAMAEIVKRYPKTGLVIVGSGPEEEILKFQASRFTLHGNVIFEPWTDDPFSYYKTADLFLSTTNYEGWGMTTVEALAAGCPVVMTQVGCAKELFIHRENAMVVPVNRLDALVSALEEVIGDPALREKLSRRARETAKSLISKDEYLSRYKHSWERCI